MVLMWAVDFVLFAIRSDSHCSFGYLVLLSYHWSVKDCAVLSISCIFFVNERFLIVHVHYIRVHCTCCLYVCIVLVHWSYFEVADHQLSAPIHYFILFDTGTILPLPKTDANVHTWKGFSVCKLVCKFLPSHLAGEYLLKCVYFFKGRYGCLRGGGMRAIYFGF